MMKSLKIGGLIMALMLFFVGAHAQNSVEKVKIGDTMPQFTLNSDVYGQVTPSDLKGEGGAGKSVCYLVRTVPERACRSAKHALSEI